MPTKRRQIPALEGSEAGSNGLGAAAPGEAAYIGNQSMLPQKRRRAPALEAGSNGLGEAAPGEVASILHAGMPDCIGEAAEPASPSPISSAEVAKYFVPSPPSSSGVIILRL